MREQGLNAPPMIYVPQNKEDYYMYRNSSQDSCFYAAQADLTGMRVPTRQAYGSYLGAQVML